MMTQNPVIITTIKITSVILILGGIGLESWSIYAQFSNLVLPKLIQVLSWVVWVPLGAHFLEAMVAAVLASRQGKGVLGYSFYTFFVGTVGLWELMDQDENSASE